MERIKCIDCILFIEKGFIKKDAPHSLAKNSNKCI